MFEGLVAAVDWSGVISGIAASAALIAGVYVVWRGSSMLLGMLDEREANAEAFQDHEDRERELMEHPDHFDEYNEETGEWEERDYRD